MNRTRRKNIRSRLFLSFAIVVSWSISLVSGCECMTGFEYFPELLLDANETLPEAEYCIYRPFASCTYLWEELRRSRLRVDRYECYSPDRRCSDSVALFYRSVYLYKLEQENTTRCTSLMQDAIDSVYYYCGGKPVCFHQDGTSISFEEVHPEWKYWLEQKLDCSDALRRSVSTALCILVAFVATMCVYR